VSNAWCVAGSRFKERKISGTNSRSDKSEGRTVVADRGSGALLPSPTSYLIKVISPVPDPAEMEYNAWHCRIWKGLQVSTFQRLSFPLLLLLGLGSLISTVWGLAGPPSPHPGFPPQNGFDPLGDLMEDN